MANVEDVLEIAGQAVHMRTVIDPLDKENAVPYALFKIAAELEELNDRLRGLERRQRWPQRRG
ncbi:MAG: hypothetical protein F4Z77_09845 [Dehalococcoidia bacterium]|nr:hypothetical protein [Chloroflexota bacterium]MXW26575.1 hypothetical protein [Dehalococcoidia bacterium]MYA53008.1 hypothetical protein [Dehalococcoidia bacterium]